MLLPVPKDSDTVREGRKPLFFFFFFFDSAAALSVPGRAHNEKAVNHDARLAATSNEQEITSSSVVALWMFGPTSWSVAEVSRLWCD